MTFLDMSLAGTAIILAASLIRALGRDRLPRRTFEALWALAALRLTVPAALPFRWSVWSALARTADRAAPAAAAPALAAGPGLAAAGQLVDGIMHFAPATLPAAAPIPWRTVLWVLGVCVLALLLTARYIRAGRRFRSAEVTEDSYVNQFSGAHPLRRRVSVRVSDRVGTPLTYGVLRPVILLPRSMDLRDRETLGYVLAHETAHIRRFDALRKLLLWAVVCVHWFNPAVWLMLVLATQDMELACDEAVVRFFGPDARRGYAHALLDMEERRSGLTGLASGFAKNAIEERIHSIMKIRKKSFLSGLLALALVLATGAVFATAAPEDQAVIGGADGPTYITVTEDAPVMFSGDVISSSDGTVYLFTDEGKPVSMTRQEYEQLIDPVAVEWWTAEDYADWLEQEKKDLQDCLGQRAWTSADGWFTWTQEKIDETIEMYEQVLEGIENGLLVSKTVDGSSDADLTEGTDTAVQFSRGTATDEGWTVHMMTEAQAAAMQEQNEAITPERQQLEEQLARLEEERAQMEQRLTSMGEAEAATERETVLAERLAQWEETLAPYMPFGISYDYSPETDEVLLYWNGQPARGLWDREKGIWISEHGGPGGSAADAPELIAVYTDGELTGLRGATAEEQEQWDGLRQESAASAAMNDHLSALMLGDGSAPEHTLAGWTDFRGRLGPYEKIYFDLGYVSADETVTAAVQADRDGGCHVSICPKGEGPGDYLTTVPQEEAASTASAEPNAYYCYSDAGLRPGDYTVCVWSSVNEPIEFALSYTVS